MIIGTPLIACVAIMAANSGNFTSRQNLLERVVQLIHTNNAGNLQNTLILLDDCDKDYLRSYGTLFEKRSLWNKWKNYGKYLDQPRPILHEAIIVESRACLEVLLESGFDILTQDANGWNFLHQLIAISHHNQSFENIALSIWRKCRRILGPEQLEEVLKQEDLEGLRPVELALHLDCIILFDEIMNTPGIYLAEKVQIGSWEHVSYDITEYEAFGCCTSRWSKSLPTIAYHVDTKVLRNETHVRILKHGIIGHWVRKKLQINLPFLLIWFVLRFGVFVAFYVVIGDDISPYVESIKQQSNLAEFLAAFNVSWPVDYDVLLIKMPNRTEDIQYATEMIRTIQEICQPGNWYGTLDSDWFYWLCLYYLLLYSFFAILYDFCEIMVFFCRRWFKWQFAIGSHKDLIVSATYYRICQFIFSFLSIFWVLLYLQANNHWFTEYGILPTCYLSVWTILYFFQMVPSVGHFVNSIQKMLTVMLQFLIVYVLIMLPYPHAFNVLVRSAPDCNTHGFEDIAQAGYTTFKVMLNMVDFGDYSPDGIHAIHILHMIYVFTVAILLINFLIALLSSSVGESVEAGDVIMMLQRLSVVSVVERRLRFVFALYYKCVSYLAYKRKNGRIYLRFRRFCEDTKAPVDHLRLDDAAKNLDCQLLSPSLDSVGNRL